MRCNPERLSQYVDEALSSAARRELEIHLLQCPFCRSEMASLRHVDAVIGSWAEHQVPITQVLEERIADSVERRRRLAPVFALSKMMPAAFGSAMAAVLVMLTVNLGLLNAPRPSVERSTPAATQSTIIKQSEQLAEARRASGFLGGRVQHQQDSPHHSRIQLDAN